MRRGRLWEAGWRFRPANMTRTNLREFWLTIQRIGRGLFLLASTVLLCSCDPGLKASPVGWNKVDDRTFEKTIDGLQFRTTTIGGLIGNSGLDVDFIITNAAEPIAARKFVLSDRWARSRAS